MVRFRFEFSALAPAVAGMLAAAALAGQSGAPAKGAPVFDANSPACRQCADWKAPSVLSCFGKSLCQAKSPCDQCSRTWCEAKLGRKLECAEGGASSKPPDTPSVSAPRPPAPRTDDKRTPIEQKVTGSSGSTVVVTRIPDPSNGPPRDFRPSTPGPDSGDWVHMFDGSTLTGWQANERPESWSVRDGSIVGVGGPTHLFWMREQCGNCEFRARVRISRGGNSGMIFRAAFGTGAVKGYEAQIANTDADWRKTGSLWDIVNITDQLVQDETWFTQEISANGPHIVIKVNGNVVVDYTDPQRRYSKGWLALQAWKGRVEFRDLAYRRLPPQ